MTNHGEPRTIELVSDTTKKWFILSGGHIEGPWNPEDIEAKLPSSSDPLIWGRGLADWLSPAEWREALHSGGSTLSESIPFDEASWSYRHRRDDKVHGPFTYADLLASLREMKDFSDVEISSPEVKDWKEIYEIQKIVDELGISRRAHQRVPMMGHLIFESPSGETQQTRVVSISSGGLSLNEPVPFEIGTQFKGLLRSPNLYAEIPCTCEVVYSGATQTGLRFLSLPAEGESAIVEYVNKFKDLGER
ncbi:MAG TPA: PilZ domain-containing protein [Pseudobdellovibrionaceae bacterium]|nr:PilZ domain-containing protein [Pseudobdellovibrionaceae bacterium]